MKIPRPKVRGVRDRDDDRRDLVTLMRGEKRKVEEDDEESDEEGDFLDELADELGIDLDD